jgi:hypothetical protein
MLIDYEMSGYGTPIRDLSTYIYMSALCKLPFPACIRFTTRKYVYFTGINMILAQVVSIRHKRFFALRVQSKRRFQK